MSRPSIALIHPGKALLPELAVYRRFFGHKGYDVSILENPSPPALEGFHIEWHMMGTDLRPKTPGRVKIHEYVSPSVPPFAAWKDAFKRRWNTIPDARIFGSALVSRRMGKDDNLPALIRPAGIDASFLNCLRASPEYDFVYSGAMDKVRNLIPWFSRILANLPGAKLLLVGRPSAPIWQAFKAHPGVTFSGQVPYTEVPGLLANAQYGLNLIPDRYPFRLQAPYKLLEYCAVGLKVISTSTAWIREFEQQRKGRFYYLEEKGSDLSWEQLRDFPFATPSVEDLIWDRLLESSGIPALLERLGR